MVLVMHAILSLVCGVRPTMCVANVKDPFRFLKMAPCADVKILLSPINMAVLALQQPLSRNRDQWHLVLHAQRTA